MLLLISRIELVLVAVLAVSVVIVYAVVAKEWYKTWAGRVMMTVLVCFALALSTSVITLFSELTTWVILLRATVYFFVLLAYCLIITSIVVIQRNRK